MNVFYTESFKLLAAESIELLDIWGQNAKVDFGNLTEEETTKLREEVELATQKLDGRFKEADQRLKRLKLLVK